MAYKRFLLMMDDQYYPAAGTGSVVASYDTLDEAVQVASKGLYPPEAGEWIAGDLASYVEVFDCDKRESVWDQG